MIVGGKVAKSSNHHALRGKLDLIFSGVVLLDEKENLWAKLLSGEEEDDDAEGEEVRRFESEFWTNFAKTLMIFSKRP